MASPFLSAHSLDRVRGWLDTSLNLPLAVPPAHPPTPPKPPATTPPRPLKRAHDGSPCDMDDDRSMRSFSPGKRRRKEDDILSGRSASRNSSVVLSERTILTATGTTKRTSSPSRRLTELRSAQPSISLAPITMPPQPLSEDTMARLGWLRKRLGNTLKGGYIPGGLKDAIEQDSDFRLSLSMEPIEEEAFDNEDKRTLDDFTLADTLQQVKSIFQSATLCTQFGRDENAWCFSVIWPLIELAIKLHGKDKWRPESVQSQSINPLYLSRIPDPSTPSKERHLFRKTDFCFSYSYLDPHFHTLYKRLEASSTMHVSHTTDNFTSRTVLFSGIEVKPENGDLKEAELQMGIWVAASLRKKMKLAESAFASTLTSRDKSDPSPSPETGHEPDETQTTTTSTRGPSFTALLEPTLTIIGHEHKLYYAYPSSAHGNVAILGPDEKFTNLSTRSVQGIFKLVSFYGAILAYGYRIETKSEQEPRGLWGDFLEEVIENLG